MWNSQFTGCLVCQVALPRDASNLYCEVHQRSARRALAKISWGAEAIPRVIILLLLFGVLIATSL